MRVKKQDRDDAVEQLRKLVRPGDTVLCVLRHVSRSGMSRRIDFYTQGLEHTEVCNQNAQVVIDAGCICGPKPALYFLSGYISTVLGMTRHKDGGLVVGGCGMDMGFHVVNSLSYAVWGKYKCLGKEGRCPSNYHMNHHDTISCPGEPRGIACNSCDAPMPGVELRTTHQGCPDRTMPGVAVMKYARCWAPYDGTRGEFRHRVADDPEEENEDGVKTHTCKTCKGKGRIPNPEGPERWDLEHEDGYALKSDWI